jgi:RNA polymerase sigma-70 factor (ECF subfamily)
LKADPALEEDRLLVAAAQRDPRRFAELYERNFTRVYAYVVRRVHDREEAQDITGEVFLQALAGLPAYEWRDVAFAAWLFRIAANAIADRWQRARREIHEPGAELPEMATLPDVERHAMLFQLVDTLPADQRRVVVARFVERRSLREIASELARTEGAVKQLQLRALKTLRAHMGEGK